MYLKELEASVLVPIRQDQNDWTPADALLTLQIPGGLRQGDAITVKAFITGTKPPNCTVYLSLAAMLQQDLASFPSAPESIDLTNSLPIQMYGSGSSTLNLTRFGAMHMAAEMPTAFVRVWALPVGACTNEYINVQQITLVAWVD